MSDKIIIFTDGGARNNPGPAAAAAVFTDESGKVIKSYSRHLGTATNNQAEYEAVILALEKAKTLKYKYVRLRTDSELVGRQLMGKYKIKDPDLQPLFIKVWNLMIDFEKVDIETIPRERNREADQLVNKELDSKTVLF